jgi:hypothetical protein
MATFRLYALDVHGKPQWYSTFRKAHEQRVFLIAKDPTLGGALEGYSITQHTFTGNLKDTLIEVLSGRDVATDDRMVLAPYIPLNNGQ